MPSDHHTPPPSSLKPDDILFVLFRHKGKIILCSLLGLIAAAVCYFKMPRIYQSEAKLLLRYVLERKSIGPVGTDAQIQQPASQGDTIINSELEILKSFDLAAQVAEAIGPEKILGTSLGESNRNAAAVVITKALTIENTPKSSVIRLVFQHNNPSVVQPVLEKLIEFYQRKHLDIHRAAAEDFLSRQTEELRFKLAKIEDELWNLKTNSGSVSSEDLKGFSVRRTKISEELSTAQADLEEKKAILQEMQKLAPAPTEASQPEAAVPLGKVNEYKNVCAQLTSMRTNLNALLTKFNEDAPFVQRAQESVSTWEKRKLKLEQDYPKLAGLGIAAAVGGTNGTDISTLMSEIRVLEIKTKTYEGQLERLKTNELTFAKAQNAILQLQRQKEVEEANYKNYAASMEQARLDELLGPGKISNIKSVQEPTPSAKAPSKRLKFMGGALGGGVLSGIVLAFLIEMFLDKTVKRPGEIKARLNVSVFSTIPYLNGKGHARVTEASEPRRSKLLPWNKEPQPAALSSQLSIPAWEGQHRLQPFFLELRERLINHFEARNLVHKPKLVAVTSCSKGAGVSTLAAGLAASLSETADGNVLLIDMNSSQGGAHPFYKGKPGCALPDVFELEKREAALLQDKLYLVKGSDASGKISRLLPKGFSELMPKILASDYDYVVFDMPPTTPGSITPRLAPHMDIVFMVLEAEKTNSETAKNAAALLAQVSANVAPILNKKRDRIPSWLSLEPTS